MIVYFLIHIRAWCDAWCVYTPGDAAGVTGIMMSLASRVLQPSLTLSIGLTEPVSYQYTDKFEMDTNEDFPIPGLDFDLLLFSAGLNVDIGLGKHFQFLELLDPSSFTCLLSYTRI
jgi:hypothetical protein